jgi:glycerol-3-phosphate dehydrogenase (NAD(P)+)
MRMVAEGVRTTETIYTLAKQLQVSVPIVEEVYKVLYQDFDPRTAILELMSRELKQE